MNGPLTTADILWLEGRLERWIRFGRVAHEDIIDRRRRQIGFASGAVFCLVRWASNEHGTIVSRLDILRAARPGSPITTVPYVTPGAESLLRIQGWQHVQEVLRSINVIEAQGIDPCAVAPDHWRHVHNRMAARQAPRPYTAARHRAWRQRQRLEP
jgi:hypothetical protein